MASNRLILFQDDLPSAAPRIVNVDVARLDIAGYDIDNGYPQRMQRLINASPTAKRACALLSEHISGQGFNKDQGFWNYVVNDNGLTGDDLLNQASIDASKWDAFYIQVNYNALFQPVSHNWVPFMNCRVGINDQAGKIAVYNNWWNSGRFGRYVDPASIDYIDTFNPNPTVIKEQVKKARGWDKYKGQVFFWSKKYEQYPECNVDAAIDSMEAEILSFQTSKSNLKNNFGDKVIYVQKGKFETDIERERFMDSFQSFIGPDGKQVIIAEIENEGEEPKILPIENKLDDKKFGYTDEKARSSIYRLLGQPAILHSDLSVGRYNQNQLPESMRYYNNNTESYRIAMQRSFQRLFGGLGLNTDFSITPLNDMSSAMQNTQGANSNTTQNDTTDNQN